MITAYFIVSARLIISESAAEPSAIASDALPAMFSVPSVLISRISRSTCCRGYMLRSDR